MIDCCVWLFLSVGGTYCPFSEFGKSAYSCSNIGESGVSGAEADIVRE